MLSALMLTEKAVRKEYWEGAELSIKTLVFTHGSTHLDNPPPRPPPWSAGHQNLVTERDCLHPVLMRLGIHCASVLIF